MKQALLQFAAPLAVSFLIAAPIFAAEMPAKSYTQSDANAGVAPFKDDHMFKALHGLDGINRIVTIAIAENLSDPRTADVVRAEDEERLHKMLVEQFCYVSGGPCHYTGMDMKAAHQHMGLQVIHFNALIEHLEDAMNKEGVPFRDQAKLLAKFAPMKQAVVDGSQN